MLNSQVILHTPTQSPNSHSGGLPTFLLPGNPSSSSPMGRHWGFTRPVGGGRPQLPPNQAPSNCGANGRSGFRRARRTRTAALALSRALEPLAGDSAMQDAGGGGRPGDATSPAARRAQGEDSRAAGQRAPAPLFKPRRPGRRAPIRDGSPSAGQLQGGVRSGMWREAGGGGRPAGGLRTVSVGNNKVW